MTDPITVPTTTSGAASVDRGAVSLIDAHRSGPDGPDFASLLRTAAADPPETAPTTTAAPTTPPPAPTTPPTPPAATMPAPPSAPSVGGIGDLPMMSTGSFGGAITPGTIGALLAAAGGSGADLVAGSIAALIGSTPDLTTGLPQLPTGATDISLTGDADARRRSLEPLFEAAGARHGVDPDLLAAVAWTESGFRPDVVSHAGAIGLMQIMPGTARELGVDPWDPVQAIDGAARYLRDALDRFGDVRLALAAYNAGPGAVASHGGIPPYPETTAYVVKVMDRYQSLQGAIA